MGGNVQINDISADNIDLSAVDRKNVTQSILQMLEELNLRFEKFAGTPLWNTELFSSRQFFSGSSLSFFDPSIDSKRFFEVKPSVGDIDIQVDATQTENNKSFLQKNQGISFAKTAKLIGYKLSAGQAISLWEFFDYDLFVQIDFEFVDFFNGRPTEWSTFSRSSPWEDMQEQIKGVFHKFLLRALTSFSVRELVLLSGKKQIPKKVKVNTIAFSVQHGVRHKYSPYLNDEGRQLYHTGRDTALTFTDSPDGNLPVFKEVQTKDSNYVQNLTDIFTLFFGRAPRNDSELKDFNSFVGILKIANEVFSNVEKKMLVDAFFDVIFSPRAQMLYRDNPKKDQAEKMKALNKMQTALGVSLNPAEVDKACVEFYKTKAK